MLLKDKVVVITGASRGVGAAIAVEFAQQGGMVAICCRSNIEAATLVAKRIWSFGGNAIIFTGDITDSAQVNQMFHNVTQLFGVAPNILVNNAYPGFFGGSVLDAPWEFFNESLNTILKGTYNCCQAVLPAMIENKFGRIINIGTTSTKELNENHAPYITAKGALKTFTRALARDYGKYNITANMVTPGLVWSNSEIPQSYPHPSEHFKRTPMNRIANASDVAKACVFFASNLSDFVTGADLPVCGGMIMQ
jgi:3-oxoacyl-[acyl-carrier protein] reductase